MKKNICWSLLLLLIIINSGVFADDAKVLPVNVFRVRAVPLVVNTDQYYRSNGEIGPYIWEDLSYSDLVGAYSMFHPGMAGPLPIGTFTSWSYADATKTANQNIAQWNTDYGSGITPFQSGTNPVMPTDTPWGNIKNTATLDATGSFVFALEYGLTDKLAFGTIIPYKNATITHDWEWIDNPDYDADIDAMYTRYAPTLQSLGAAIASFPTDGNPLDLAAMQELYGSVAWAAEARKSDINDPFGNGIPASLFPFYADQNPDDTDGYADIYELANFYYPTMTGKGFGDIEVGFKYRFAGQGLTDPDKRYALAVKSGLRLPTGKTFSEYDPDDPTKQFAEVETGDGQMDFEVHLGADYYSKVAGKPWEITGEIFYNYQMKGESNTTLDLLKNVDLDVATTIARLGKTYEVDPGDVIAWEVASSMEIVPRKFSLDFTYLGFDKGRNEYFVPNAPAADVQYTTSLGTTETLEVDDNGNGKLDAEEWADWKAVHGEGDLLSDTESYGQKITFGVSFKDFSSKTLPMPYEIYGKYHLPLAGSSNWAPNVLEFGFKTYLKFWG